MSPLAALLSAFILLMVGVTALSFIISHLEIFLGLVCLILLLWVLFYVFFILKNRTANVKQLEGLLLQYGESSTAEQYAYFTLRGQYDARIRSLELQLMHCVVTQSVTPHLPVLRRKKGQLVYLGEYGEEISARWIKELRSFLQNVIFPLDTLEHGAGNFEMSPIYVEFSNISNPYVLEYWINYLDGIIQVEAPSIPQTNERMMSGHEYEFHVAQLIRELSWAATVTPGSGDHGADIIAERESIRIAVQCKLYSSTVGNKSVQEAYSAKDFYDCQHACVISNALYTPAAKQAAAKLKVDLLHHDDLVNYLTRLSNA
jgi:Ca2+/Na+ antiporter